MAVNEEQRAILDLLLGHGLDYEAIGAAAGIDAAEARARARAGLAALGGADPGPELADFLLGRAAGGRRAAATERLQSDAAANALARRIAAGLRAELELPELPEIPEARDEGGGRRVPPLAGLAARLHGRRLLGLIAGGAGVVLVGVAVLVVTGAFSSGDGGSSPAADEPPQSQDVRVRMRPVGEGRGSGGAVIGLTDDFRPYLDLELTRLGPAPRGRIHMLWIDGGNGHGLPLPAAIPLSGEGAFHQRFELAPQLVPVLGLGRFLEVVLVTGRELRDLSEQVVRAGSRASGPITDAEDLPERPGAVVLRGRIPER